MLIGLIIFVIVLILISIFLIFYQPIILLFEKIFFKHNVAKKVYQIARDNDYYLLNKVALKIEDKVIHFDHLLFANKYIYCIGKTYYKLAISGKLNDNSWLNYQRNNKFTFIKNPTILHRERVNYFIALTGASRDLCVSTIVINNSCLINTTNYDYDQVINLKSLSKMIQDYENQDVEILEQDTLYNLVQQILKNGVEK